MDTNCNLEEMVKKYIKTVYGDDVVLGEVQRTEVERAFMAGGFLIFKHLTQVVGAMDDDEAACDVLDAMEDQFNVYIDNEVNRKDY